MFKDFCKTGGYNLEGCHAVGEARLSAIILIVLLLAIIQGIDIRTSRSALHLSSKRKSSNSTPPW